MREEGLDAYLQKQVVWSTNKKESVTIFNGNIIVDGHYNQMIRKDRDGLYGPEIVLLLNKILSINIDQPGFFILDLLNDNIYRVDAVKDMYGLEMYNIPDFHNPVQADNMAE